MKGKKKLFRLRDYQPLQMWKNRGTKLKTRSKKGPLPGKGYINRDTWLWNDDVEMKFREKKRLHHKFLNDKTVENWQIYINTYREAKKEIVVIRAVH